MTATGNQNQAMAKLFMVGVPLILLLVVRSSCAAPGSSNEDQAGGYASSPSGQDFRNRDSNPTPVEYNLVPQVSEPEIPVETSMGIEQQLRPIDINAVLNYLLAARHSRMNNRALFYPGLGSRSELGSKRSLSNSRSRYCAFNAVSCFGRKK